jgi:hypothetical protein
VTIGSVSAPDQDGPMYPDREIRRRSHGANYVVGHGARCTLDRNSIIADKVSIGVSVVRYPLSADRRVECGNKK